MNRPRMLTRRNMLQAAAALGPLSLIGCTTTGGAGAVAAERLQPGDPVARSLLYVTDSRKVPADHPLAARHSVEQRCANCVHVRGDTSEAWRACPAFPGKLVSQNGWCSLWASA